MFDEKNIYVRQAEVKGSFKQSASGTFLINELTVNSTLKNYKKVLEDAFKITTDELNKQNENNNLKKETTLKLKPKKNVRM